MQRRHEHRPLHGKPELAPFQQVTQHLTYAKPLRQAAEQKRAANPLRSNFASIDIGEDDAALCVASDRRSQSVEFTALSQHILTAERLDCPLAHRFAFADTFHEIQIAVAPRDSLNNEHALVVTVQSPSNPRAAAQPTKMLLLHPFLAPKQVQQNSMTYGTCSQQVPM